MYTILSTSRNTRLLLARNDTLALAGFRVVSPRTPEEAPYLALEKKVDAVLIGHSIEQNDRRILIEALRRTAPDSLIFFVYAAPERSGEPLADVSLDVTSGTGPLIKELQKRLPREQRRKIAGD
jgi:hypothetical protein